MAGNSNWFNPNLDPNHPRQPQGQQQAYIPQPQGQQQPYIPQPQPPYSQQNQQPPPLHHPAYLPVPGTFVYIPSATPGYQLQPQSNFPGQYGSGATAYNPHLVVPGYGQPPAALPNLPPIHLGMGPPPPGRIHPPQQPRATSMNPIPPSSPSKLRGVKSVSNLNSKATRLVPSSGSTLPPPSHSLPQPSHAMPPPSHPLPPPSHSLPPRPPAPTPLPSSRRLSSVSLASQRTGGSEVNYDTQSDSGRSVGSIRSVGSGLSYGSSNKSVRDGIKMKRYSGEPFTTAEATEFRRQRNRNERRARKREKEKDKTESARSPSNRHEFDRFQFPVHPTATSGLQPFIPPSFPPIDVNPSPPHAPDASSVKEVVAHSPPENLIPLLESLPNPGVGEDIQMGSPGGSGNALESSPSVRPSAPIPKVRKLPVFIPGAPYPTARYHFSRPLQNLYPCPPWTKKPTFKWLSTGWLKGDVEKEPEVGIRDDGGKGREDDMQDDVEMERDYDMDVPPMSEKSSPKVAARHPGAKERLMQTPDSERIVGIGRKKEDEGDDLRLGKSGDDSEEGLGVRSADVEMEGPSPPSSPLAPSPILSKYQLKKMRARAVKKEKEAAASPRLLRRGSRERRQVLQEDPEEKARLREIDAEIDAEDKKLKAEGRLGRQMARGKAKLKKKK